MSKFSEVWDTKVRPLIVDYLDKDYLATWNDIMECVQREKRSPTDEEIQKLSSYNLIDGFGMTQISSMSFYIEHALADDRECLAHMQVYQVHSVLSSSSYWENVFKNDLSSDEAKKLLAIRDGLTELIETI